MKRFGPYLICAIMLTVGLSSCGKKGAPHAPATKGEPIYPRVYPVD